MTIEEANIQKLYNTWLERCPIYLALTKPMKVATAMQVTRR
jgi:hypothetical protein